MFKKPTNNTFDSYFLAILELLSSTILPPIFSSCNAFSSKIDLRNDMNTMEGRIDAKMEQLNENVKGIRFTIENEIRPSIALIAESHFILNRKLDEAIRVAGSIEMTRIRVSILEDDVKKLKRAVNM